MTRQLTEQEKAIIDKLLEPDFPGRNELRRQLDQATATSTNDPDNYGSIRLEVSPTPTAAVTGRIPVEGMTTDADGVPINILLHVVNGIANELEILKADGTPIKRRITPKNIQVTVN